MVVLSILSVNIFTFDNNENLSGLYYIKMPSCTVYVYHYVYIKVMEDNKCSLLQLIVTKRFLCDTHLYTINWAIIPCYSVSSQMTIFNSIKFQHISNSLTNVLVYYLEFLTI